MTKLSSGDMKLLRELIAISDREKARAEEIGAALVARNPDVPEVRIAYARARSLRQDYATAARQLDIALCLQDGANGRFNLGYCYRQLGDYERAAAHLHRGYGLSGGKTANHAALLASTLAVVGRRDEAKALVREAQSWAPSQERAVLDFLAVFLAGGADLAGLSAAERGRAQAHFRANEGAADQAILFWMKYDCHAFGRLDNKARLAHLLQDARGQAKPAMASFWPLSFALLQDAGPLASHVQDGGGGAWILKPSDFSGGQGMRLLDNTGARALAEDRKADGVLQRYISPPFLLAGRKTNMRTLLAFTRHERPEAFLWQNAVVTLAPTDYSPPEPGSDMTPHVINLLRYEPEVVSRPVGAFDSHIVPLADFIAADPRLKGLPERLAALAGGLLETLEQAGFYSEIGSAPEPSAFPPRFVGLDIGLDAEAKPWLFEVERYPGMHPGTQSSAAIMRSFRRDWIDFLFCPDRQVHPAFKRVT